MRAAAVAPVALVVLLAAGCAPAPAPHPMGAGCTWPARIDPRRDAVLLSEAYGATDTVALLDVQTGTVRARCAGVVTASAGAGMGVDDDQSGSTGSVILPPVGDDFRSAATGVGVVDLATGAVTPNPDPSWRAVAFPGGGHVLRRHSSAEGSAGDAADPAGWCVAPSAGAPQAECVPIAGDGPGAPALHDDGTVGWAPRRPVPVVFTALGQQVSGQQGSAQQGSVQQGSVQQVPGTVQTDGRVVLQARVDGESVSLAGPGSVVDASRRAGTISDDAFRYLTRYSAIAGHPVWYTVEDAGRTPVAATLHVARSTLRQVVDAAEAGGLSRPAVRGALVVDGGAAVVLSVLGGGSTSLVPSLGSSGAYFVRVDEQGAPRVVGRLPFDPGTGKSAVGVPRILAWPDADPAAAG